MPVILKYLLTAAIIVIISEVARRSEKIGALIGSLPIVAILAMTWIFLDSKSEGQSTKVANYAYYTFWYVIPTLPMFLVVSKMLKNGSHFWLALAAYVVGTLVLFYLSYIVLKKFGVHLM